MGGPGMMGQPGQMMGRGMGGPGMMGPSNAGNMPRGQNNPGYGPGVMQNMTPEQHQQHWKQMRAQGYGPGAMQNMTPEQHPLSSGPGAMQNMMPEQHPLSFGPSAMQPPGGY